MLWPFVNLIDTSEIFDLASTSASIQTFWVTRDTLIERRVNEDLDKFVRLEEIAHHPALGAKRGDERAEHDQTGLCHQLGDFSDTTNVLHAIGVRKPQVLSQTMTDVVAIKQSRVGAAFMQLCFN